jgi:2-isopropylmalate synthase
VQLELLHHNSKVRGRGLSTDILEASALAYLAAINRLRSMSCRERQVTQHAAI